jgi:DNA-binding MarR family transcriptional regulator
MRKANRHQAPDFPPSPQPVAPTGRFPDPAPALALVKNDRSSLVALAETEYAALRRREAFLPSALLGEPGWDMLLDLFVRGSRGERVAMTSACKATEVSQTTGLRWLAHLEQAGLIEKATAPHDRRVHYVALTEAGRQAISRWLAYRAGLSI